MNDARHIKWFTYPSDYGYVVHARILDHKTYNQAGIERHFTLQELTDYPERSQIDLERMQLRLMDFIA